MSNELNSQLSAFVDDELTPEESELFVRRLCRDENLRRAAACYGMIGAAIRGETAVTAPAGFVTGVMMAVEGQAVQAVRERPGGRSHSARNWGFALAASVAIAAIALMTLPGTDNDRFETVVADNAETPGVIEATPAAVAANTAPAPVSFRARQETELLANGPAMIAVTAQNVPIVMPVSAERRAQLNNLLLQHYSSSGVSRQPGLVGFRNVGFVTQSESQR